jgi:hypothetical protein
MITFKILDKKVPIPTSWRDVTYSQYVYMIVPRTFVEYIHLFSGIPLETLNSAQIKNVDKLSLALSFLSLSPDLTRTETVGPFILPGMPQFESLGQFEDLRNLVKKYPRKERKDFDYTDLETECELYLTACAIYFQKVQDGSYNSSKVEKVKDELRSASAVEVLSNGAFFFAKGLNLSLPQMTLYQKATRAMKRFLQAFPGYQKTLDFLQRSSQSPRE